MKVGSATKGRGAKGILVVESTKKRKGYSSRRVNEEAHGKWTFRRGVANVLEVHRAGQPVLWTVNQLVAGRLSELDVRRLSVEFETVTGLEYHIETGQTAIEHGGACGRDQRITGTSELAVSQ